MPSDSHDPMRIHKCPPIHWFIEGPNLGNQPAGAQYWTASIRRIIELVWLNLRLHVAKCLFFVQSRCFAVRQKLHEFDQFSSDTNCLVQKVQLFFVEALKAARFCFLQNLDIIAHRSITTWNAWDFNPRNRRWRLWPEFVRSWWVNVFSEPRACDPNSFRG